MKPFIKWIIRFVILLLILLIIYIAVPTYPQPFFDFIIQHKNFTVYSDEQIQEDFIKIIDEVEFRIKDLEIYESTFQPKIYCPITSRPITTDFQARHRRVLSKQVNQAYMI